MWLLIKHEGFEDLKFNQPNDVGFSYMELYGSIWADCVKETINLLCKLKFPIAYGKGQSV